MDDCLFRGTFKCNDCKEISNYEWDYTEVKFDKDYNPYKEKKK